MVRQPATEQDPGAVFDAWVARNRERANTTSSGLPDPGRLTRLLVHPDLPPRARPDVRREITPWVPDALRAVVRGLLCGARPWPLYLYGDSGVGKTSLALILLDLCGPHGVGDDGSPERVRDWFVGYCDVRCVPGLKIDADKGRLLWSKRGDDRGTYAWHHLLAAVKRAPLFVFDELGVGAATADFRLDAILEVVAERCVNPVRPFVVTGNVGPDELARIYDNRVARRVTWGTVVRWTRTEPTIAVWERKPDGAFANATGEAA